ncbi:hypothetical protein DCCM_3127 [Desulfocucumis palustris]|uniref:Uncharacterized protein n=1 Tax=Desulfocucumis palustris TaxID=1898651 RepID=A0A2L2XIF4_9FIRM|nr:hypothetical protein [Desulfocucumis palustris]GBF34016.1 hypothetical protein DCCM_3127 [Desulfocucumis palustris]
MTKAKDMTQGQIAHTFCTWCYYRLFVAGSDYWGCGLVEKKKEEHCSYKKALLKEEEKVS